MTTPTQPPSATANGDKDISLLSWLETNRTGNFGDALNTVVLGELGFAIVPPSNDGTANPDRCMMAIGSVLAPWHVARARHPIDVWGAGWRGEPLTDAELERLTVHAVRGPLTATAVGCTDVPLGDPALLLPRFHTPAAPVAARPAVVIPHILDPVQLSPADVGCDAVVSVRVHQRGRWHRRFTPTPLQVVDRIAAAGFVLTGALHGAIVAQAFGVPWAPWAGTRVDCPAKWLDWAAYLGIESTHVTDRHSGEKWWDRHGSTGKVRPLDPLLEAFPYHHGPVMTGAGADG